MFTQISWGKELPMNCLFLFLFLFLKLPSLLIAWDLRNIRKLRAAYSVSENFIQLVSNRVPWWIGITKAIKFHPTWGVGEKSTQPPEFFHPRILLDGKKVLLQHPWQQRGYLEGEGWDDLTDLSVYNEVVVLRKKPGRKWLESLFLPLPCCFFSVFFLFISAFRFFVGWTNIILKICKGFGIWKFRDGTWSDAAIVQKTELSDFFFTISTFFPDSMIFPFFHVNKNLTTTHLATKNGLNSNQPSRFVWGSMFGRFQPTKRGASGWSSRTMGKELAWKCPSAISGHQPLDGSGVGWA